MKRVMLILICLSLMSGSVFLPESFASNGSIGTSSAQFLKLGFGGRAMAMGGAFVGLADDVTAVYWNPAGLVGINSRELCFMHQTLFQDITFEYFAYAQPLGKWGSLGGGMAYLHMDKFTGRDQTGEYTSDFTSSDMIITLSYAFQAGSNLFLGTSIKYIGEQIEDQDAKALAFDLGWLVRTPLDKLRVGGTLQNIGQDLKFVSEAYGLPRFLKFGVAYSDTLGGSPMNVAMDYFIPSDDENTLHLGMEYVYRNLAAARIGYGSGSDSDSNSKLGFGVGLIVDRAQTYRLDYSFRPQGVLGDSHIVSLLMQF